MSKDIYQLLKDKVEKEYEEFYDSLVLKPEEIIDRCYEKVFKEEIATCFYTNCERLLTPKEASELLKKDNLLQVIYDDWLRQDAYYMEDIENIIIERGNREMMKLKKEKESER